MPKVKVKGKEIQVTGKQEAFINEYAKDRNGKQAAIRAGYSPTSAAEMASENLTKPNVQEIMQGLGILALSTMDDVMKNSRVDVARVSAASKIMDRVYGLPTQMIDNNVKMVIEIVNPMLETEALIVSTRTKS